MKAYEFQLLRFMPDRVSGEFVNVGLVLYCREERFLAVETLRKTARLKEFFPGLDIKYLSAALKHMRKAIQEVAAKCQEVELFAPPAGLREITLSVLPDDDTALFFTEVRAGIDASPQAAFDDLKASMLFKYQKENEERSESDRDVWDKVYKRYFQEQEILEKLRQHTINTSHDSISFEFAWKNEHWHCYSPVNFDLRKGESIKNKVYRWKGKLAELSTSKEPVEVHLLASLPSDMDMRQFVLEMLEQQSAGAARLSVVTPEEASQFSEQLRLELEGHK